MVSPTHFYLTFNPYFNEQMEPGYTQAHEFFDFLRAHIEKNSTGTAYWGKMIGHDRDSNVNFDDFRKIIADNKAIGHSTHLYITDFAHMWVAKVETVKENISKKELDQRTLPFYLGKKVEIWFEVSDFTLLEYTSEECARKLRDLYISHTYSSIEIDGLSPFTTGIRYPAIVQDWSEESYFDEIDNCEHTHLILKETPSVGMNTQAVLKGIHSFAFPENLYRKLPHGAKAEIELAELDMLGKHHHNLRRVAFGHIKALEIILNDLIIHHIKREKMADEFFVGTDSMPPRLYMEGENMRGRVLLSHYHKNFSIGQLITFCSRALQSNHPAFKAAFKGKKTFLYFVTKDFKQIIDENQLLAIRGMLAHNDSSDISLHDALAIRNLILGVGHKGLIHELYSLFYPEEIGPIAKVLGKYDSKTIAPKLKLVA